MAWLSSGDLLGLAWHIMGYTDAQHAEARRMVNELDANNRRWTAVRNRVANGG